MLDDTRISPETRMTDTNALQFAALNNAKAVSRPDLAQDMVHVILNSLLSQIQSHCDLFIGKAFGQQFHQLLFPAAKSMVGPPRERGRSSCLLSNRSKQNHREK